MSTETDPFSYRILIIDDNPAIHEDFKKILCGEEYDVTEMEEDEAIIFRRTQESMAAREFAVDCAFQGEEGLAMVRQSLEEDQPYAMAFIDVRMPPGWDGIETIQRIWDIYPELQVVLCTAYSDYSWEEMHGELGSRDNIVILKKPFDNVEVLQLAHSLSQKWTATSRTRQRLDELDLAVQKRTRELSASNRRLHLEIEERKRIEQALRQSELRFKKAFQASPVAIAIQDQATGQCVDVNDNFLKLTGHSREQVLGKTPEELDLIRVRQESSPPVQALLSAEPLRNLPCQVRTVSGDHRQALVSTEHFTQEERDYLLVLLQDVSELASLEQELQQAQKMEAVGQLAAGVAHDFNNILTIIQGHAHLRLATETLPGQTRESLQEVCEAAERAASLTRQLLAFSRKQVIRLRPVDLGEQIRTLGRLLQRLLGEHIRLELDADEDLPLVQADPCNIEQIIINLCVNARDAMPEGGPLTLRARAINVDKDYTRHRPEAVVGSFVCLSVIDGGTGMDEETQRHIFEPFFTTKEVGKGTGMGLATVHGIARQHKGWIELESQLNVGSTFRVFLPVSEGVVASQVFEPSALRAVSDEQTILYAEDEPTLRTMITEVLEHYGYRVLAAANGPEALALWQTRRDDVDLLLTDMVMPEGMSGAHLGAALQKDRPDLRVIYTSGYTEELFGGGIELVEGENYLPKPYTPSGLASLIARCLAQFPRAA